MIDDSPKSKPQHLSESDANFLASLLMGEPSSGPVVDVSREGEAVLDLTDSPTLTFDPAEGMAGILSSTGQGKVSDLVDVALVLSTKPSAEVIARSIFGQPEPTGALATKAGANPRASAAAVGASHGTSHGWFHPVGDTASMTAVAGENLFGTKNRPEPPVAVRLETAAAASGGDAVVFAAAKSKDERRRKFMLAALFLGAVAIGGGLVALLAENGTFGNRGETDPSAETVPTTAVPTTAVATTAAPVTAAPTSAAPTTAAPATAAPTTTAPTTTVPSTTEAPTTTVAPTTAAPATTSPPVTRPPTTRAPRTTRPPATTQPPATTPPTTAAPTVTFAPPTWADPLD